MARQNNIGRSVTGNATVVNVDGNKLTGKSKIVKVMTFMNEDRNKVRDEEECYIQHPNNVSGNFQ